MAFSFTHSIIPMSELRMNPDKVKKQLKKSPVVITNKGRPDFGICDLDTLAIANRVKEIKDILVQQGKSADESVILKMFFRN